MPKISNDTLQQYFASNGIHWPLHEEAVKMYKQIKVHADGIMPKELISTARPSESPEILTYREKNYRPKTKLPISQVVNSFGKIRRSPDWNIDFPKEKISARIPEGEDLNTYCTQKLPGHISITNWAFGILLRQNLIDAHAVIAVIPLEVFDNETLAKPVPILFNSDQVMQFDEMNQFCILKSRKKISYLDEANTNHTGDVFYYIDDQEILIYQQSKDGFVITFQQTNVTGKMPAFMVRAEAFVQFDNMTLQRSILDAMIPFLDTAAQESSDLQGSKIQHLYPKFWYFQNRSCTACNGTGKVPHDGGPKICDKCDNGKVKFSPFANISIDPAGIGNQANPIPPAGYISMDTAILKLQQESIDKEIFNALSSLNMQFLNQTPLSISGDAKSVDREELNNTVYTYAEHMIYSIDKVIYFINEWRYSYVVPDELKRKAMLPNIPVPQNFDLLPEDYLMKEVTDARTAKINPLLIATLEQQLAAKKFYNQPDLSANIKLFFDLDPLPGVAVEEKMMLLQNRAITQEDFVISSYMAAFIKRALREDKDFATKDYVEQMKVLSGYAADKMKTADDAAKMAADQKQKVLLEMQQNQPAA